MYSAKVFNCVLKKFLQEKYTLRVPAIMVPRKHTYIRILNIDKDSTALKITITNLITKVY